MTKQTPLNIDGYSNEKEQRLEKTPPTTHHEKTQAQKPAPSYQFYCDALTETMPYSDKPLILNLEMNPPDDFKKQANSIRASIFFYIGPPIMEKHGYIWDTMGKLLGQMGITGFSPSFTSYFEIIFKTVNMRKIKSLNSGHKNHPQIFVMLNLFAAGNK